jgi:hypothetical protein
MPAVYYSINNIFNQKPVPVIAAIFAHPYFIELLIFGMLHLFFSSNRILIARRNYLVYSAERCIFAV